MRCVDLFLQAYPLTIGLFVLLVVAQVLFCYKVKHLWISILPSILFALLFVAVGIPCMAMVMGAVTPLLSVAFPVIFSIQLLLCFRVRRVGVRLIPTILLPLISIAFLAMTIITSGWDVLGYLFFMLYAAFAWVIDGIAWGVWAMSRHIQKYYGHEVFFMDNKHSSDKLVGIFLLTVLSFIFIYKYEYIALAVWPAVASQFPVLWKKDIEPLPNGYKQINKTSVVTYVVSFAISVLMLFLVVLYRNNFNSSLIIVAILASLAHEAIMLTILIPFVYDHRTDKRAISWGLYGLLVVILRSLSPIWLSETPIQGVFVLIIFPLIIIGAIIRCKILLKSVKRERL